MSYSSWHNRDTKSGLVMHEALNLKRYVSKSDMAGFAHQVLIMAIAVILIISGIGYYVSTRPKNNRALAIAGEEWCVESGTLGQACLNARIGGPLVHIYIHRGQPNNYFDFQQRGDYYVLMATGTTNPRWHNQCIGNAYNKPDTTTTSLNPCGSGWGTNFIDYKNCKDIYGNTGIEWKNVHSGKFLAPGNSPGGYQSNTPFILNGPETCFTIFS
jgi:hypothetical protein